MSTLKKVVISVGNPLKSDDNISNLVLEELQKNSDKNVKYIKGSTNPENFIELIRKMNPEVIYIIDTAIFPGNVGDIKKFQLKDIINMNISTHSFPITFFHDLLPESEIMLIGIKPKSLEMGEKLSPELKNKFKQIVEKVKMIILLDD
jgi:hydrogenase 3 maturation protease